MNTIHSQTQKHTARKHRGWLSIELVMTLPILMMMLLGIFEFTMLFFARGEIVEAARIGARKATYPGVTEADVEQEVLRVLNPRYFEYTTVETSLGAKSGDVVSVIVKVPMQLASPDLLWPVGFSLKDQYLISETRMVRE
jgi:hypothetical protein